MAEAKNSAVAKIKKISIMLIPSVAVFRWRSFKRLALVVKI
jgi:hypothetical protein